MSTRKVVLLDGDPIGLFGGGGGAKPEEIGIKYDEENDVIQLYYDGSWRDWKTGGMAYPVGTEILFSYLNIPQQFVVPATGIWKVELWGGKGGDSIKYYNGGSGKVNGGNGAYIKGNVRFESDDVLYIVTGDGGQGNTQSGTGYNGGGNGGSSQGGGATHLAKTTGDVLKVTPVNDIIMVAGGGGGGGCGSNWGTNYPHGGSAGYPSGSNGTVLQFDGSTVASGGGGGTQGAGGAGYSAGTFGQGGGGANNSGSGGGGYYGGGSGYFYSRGGYQGSGGGGGSSFAASNVTDLQYTTHSDIQGHAKLTYLGRGA